MARPTVHDVARVAGVSLSTVDRVLNRRVSVRQSTRDQVEAAMRSLGYVRNSAAASLARGGTRRFVFLIPSGANSFMRMLENEVAAYSETLAADAVEVEMRIVPAFDGHALASALTGIDADGVALVAVDSPAVREAVRGLRARGLGIVTVVSDLPAELRDHFVGIDNIWAGRTAAGLLGRFCDARRGPIATVAGAMVVQDHAERRLGFQQVMASDFPHLELLPMIEAYDDAEVVEEKVSALVAENPGISGIYSLGAGNRGLVAALSRLERRPQVVLHELTDHSRRWLLENRIDAVIRQDPAREARSALRTLIALSCERPFHFSENQVGIEIFLRDNLP